MDQNTKIISQEELKAFVVSTFLHYKFNKTDAVQCADVLLASDLRGIDSHGVARLTGYCRLINKGRINPHPQIKIVKSKGVNFSVDADGAIGLVSAPWAMREVEKRTLDFGAGFSSIGNSNHFGIAGYHAMKALKFNAMGIAMTNASPLVSVSGGKERLLGTNPIAVAIPAKTNDPFVLDMATSAAANGKMQIASRKKENIPNGWAIDKDGIVSEDPNILKDQGSLLPLGSHDDVGLHKGYGLSSWVDIFSGVLSGANFGPWVPPFVSFLNPLDNLPGKGLGHFVGAWSVDGFMDYDEFTEKMDIWIKRFKESTPIVQGVPVKVHGEPEMEQYNQRVKNGIPVHPAVLNDLLELGKNINVKL
jgi:LDH2 family malate/lactate/ureidoglycolate dehydrogenase